MLEPGKYYIIPIDYFGQALKIIPVNHIKQACLICLECITNNHTNI